MIAAVKIAVTYHLVYEMCIQ